jgi:hypothetical protein
MVRLFPRQADAFAHGDTNGLTAFFKFFPDNVDKFLVVKSARKICTEIVDGRVETRTFQELLRDGNWIRPYWDIEYYADAPVEVGAARRRVIPAFHKLLREVFPFIGEEFDEEKTRWSDSSGQYGERYKVSFHCVYADPCIAFAYNRANEGRDKRRALHQFGMLSIEESKQFPDLWEGGTCCIDGTVWSTNRAMRCVGCHKPGDTRILNPVNPDYTTGDLSKSTIESHLISCPEPARPCKISELVELFKKKSKVPTQTLDKIAADLGCTIDTVNDSLVTLKTKPGGRTCPITNERYMPGNNRAFLHIKAGEVFYRQHGVEGQKKVGEVLQKRYKLFSDIGILNQLEKTAGDEFCRGMVEEYLRDTVVYINAPFNPEYVVKVDAYEAGFGLVGVDSFKYKTGANVFGKDCREFRCQKINDDKVVYEYVSIAHVLAKMVKRNQIRTYSALRYVPFSHVEPYIGNRVFNTFVPFDFLSYEPKTKVPPFEEHAMYKLLKTDLTGRDEESFEYLLSYCAHKLQHPSIRIDTALCFVRTIQGIGKGQFSKWISMIFDYRNVKIIANLDHLFGNFNSHIRSSLWVFLEEIKSKGGAWEQAGRLKDLISSESQVWEKKYHEAEEGGWHGQIVVFSNSSYGLRVEVSDRRYVLFDTEYTLRDDKEFHDRVSAETMNPDYIATVFKFLMERDVSKWNWRKIPKTKTRTAIKQACESVFMSFTRWFFEHEGHFKFTPDYNRFGYVEERVQVKKNFAITNKKHLVAAFRKYKDVSGHPSKTNETNAILDGIKLLWGRTLKPAQCKINGSASRLRCFKIDLLKLQTELSKQFRDPVVLEMAIE